MRRRKSFKRGFKKRSYKKRGTSRRGKSQFVKISRGGIRM